MNDRDSAWRLHQSTKHGTPPSSPHRLVEFRRLDPDNAPLPFKRYQGIDSIPLPRQVVESSIPATAVLSGERGESRKLDSRLLMTLLFLSAGVTRMTGPPGHRTYFRPSMSAGNLHPIEIYVIAGDGGIEDLDVGVYHFDPLEIALRSLRSEDHRARSGLSAPLSIILTGIPWRTTWKYGERGWRHLYWDAGTLLANLISVADAHGLAHEVLLGFDDEAVAGLVGIDGSDEMPLAVVAIGAEDSNAGARAVDSGSISPGVDPVAPRPMRLPLLHEAQGGSSLKANEVEAWRVAGERAGRHVPTAVDRPRPSGDTIEDVILRRGSTRQMVEQSVARGRLDWPMSASTRAVGIDVIPGRTLLDHFLNVHAVDDLDPGAYRYAGDRFELVGTTDRLREKSATLCLRQPLGGDSAYTVFHCADLEPILGTLGSRGYRVAQLEAGVASGRLALCAFALGLGATGLTFFDDLVSAFFHTSDQPMLVTAVGAASSPPAASGTPGSPRILRR